MMSYRPLEKQKQLLLQEGSRGIGKAIAMKLGNLGASIVLNYRSDTDTFKK